MKANTSIALVDDHRLFRKGMAAILNATEGFSVSIEAGNGHELLEILKERPLPDIVVLDLEMPGMDGMQTLTELRKLAPESKVILLTMYEDECFVVHFMESGANGFLLKDAHPSEVELAIRNVATGSYYFNDTVSQALLNGLKSKKQEFPAMPGRESLAEREVIVLKLICLEMNTPEIAKKMFLSPRRIEGCRKKMLQKTGAKKHGWSGVVCCACWVGGAELLMSSY